MTFHISIPLCRNSSDFLITTGYYFVKTENTTLNVATTTQEKNLMAGVVVGSTIALEALFAGPITGASMNPARSFGPALVSGHLQYVWIYLTAPVLGAILACPICRLIKGKECCPIIEQDSWSLTNF